MANPHDDGSQELVELRARVRTLEAELRARDEFIIAAAHELRNPISPLVLHVHRLQSAAQQARDGAVPAGWLGEQLDAFARRLGRFMSALNRILDVSRMHRGEIELVPEDVDLSEVVREVVASFERELAASGSTLSLEIAGPIVGAWDRMRLEQIVSNLISNAIRYGNSAPIRVAVRRGGEQALLVVADRGIGIREEDKERIFRRFERAKSSHPSGFGVGLWIVRQLCEAMGGGVAVESGGVGSAFTVTLPIKRGERGDDE